MPTLYSLARPILFRIPAETSHELTIRALGAVPRPVRSLLRSVAGGRDERLRTRAFGLDFPSPVGLAAGVDKAGVAFNAFGSLGFAFVEIGTVTAEPQPGNPQPRLFRVPRDRALLNRMGFNNPGAAAVARRLAAGPIETLLGVNVGKSKVTPLERAIDDYLRSVELLLPFADYLVVNVSSPNTPGLRDLQDAEPLKALLTAVVRRAGEDGRRAVPVLVKLSPDLTDTQVDQAVDVAGEAGASGVVAVNTTVSREGLRTDETRIAELGAGGVSGEPLRSRAQAVVARIYRRTGGRLPIVGVGGIFTAEDAWQRIRAGASLVQVYTGLIYQGPGVARRIERGLVERLAALGLPDVAAAVGTAAREAGG